ncbi:MAG: pilus assembly FimT family protein [Gemmatimonadaceae bacterium]
MRRGFTLLELLVVLAILSVVTAVVTPSLFSAVRPTELEQGASELTHLISRARASAVERAVPSRLVLVPRDCRYTLQFGVSGDSTIGATLPLAPSVQLDDPRHSITLRFDAIGRATPERIVLRSGERLAIVRVDPWSGLASVTQR